MIQLKHPLYIFLTLTFASHGVQAAVPVKAAVQALACTAIATGQARAMPELSAKMIQTLREVLADTFLSSDRVFGKHFRTNPAMLTQIALMGSSVSQNSYGIYRLQLLGQDTESVMKVPLKYSLLELFDYFDGGELPSRIDPTDFSDTSQAAVESRRTAGFGILLQHFFNLMEEKTGIKVAATLQAYYSSRQLQGLLTGDLRLSDERRKYFTNEGEARSVAEDSLPTFGVVSEKLNIVAEVRDDGFKTEELQFTNLAGVKEQVLWIARLLNQLGIEILDPNPVLDARGRVILLDLEASAVALNVDGKVQILFGIFDESDRKLILDKFDRNELFNRPLLGKAQLERKDLN